ncbi:MAG: flagellar brake protein [Gammaproteobacteria bacterium]|nr:flagellar brake protein [Gammaproteobacteria bacterium]
MEDKKEFKVKLGDPIQLQFIPQDGRERLTAKVIGHSPNKSIIISAPGVNGKLPLLKENQPFVVRMLQGNDVYGFESSIIKYYSIPYPHVHLRHPKDIECITVRGSQRVETEIVVSVATESRPAETLSISMLNTSATGALLQTKKELGKLDDGLSISIELEIANIKKYLRINAIIRNISTPEDRDDDEDMLNKYGVQFLDLNDEQKLIINAYVYEQIVLHMQDH